MPGGDRSPAWAGGWLLLVMGGALLIALLMVYRFDPVRHSLYPRCFLYAQTGIQCPGCGGLRATHQLLHGNVREAFRLNALFVTLLPVGAAWALRLALMKLTGKPIRHPFTHPRWVWLLAIAIIAFGVLRNLPWREWWN
jgi:hypothetical protein